MPNCKHNSYKDHDSFFGAMCKGNPDNWYPKFVLAVLFFGTLIFLGVPISVLFWIFG